MTSIKLDEGLLDGVEQFIADRDEAPEGSKMSYEDAVNVIVLDWLVGQGYIPLPGEPDDVIPALQAAKVPKVPKV